MCPSECEFSFCLSVSPSMFVSCSLSLIRREREREFEGNLINHSSVHTNFPHLSYHAMTLEINMIRFSNAIVVCSMSVLLSGNSLLLLLLFKMFIICSLTLLWSFLWDRKRGRDLEREEREREAETERTRDGEREKDNSLPPSLPSYLPFSLPLSNYLHPAPPQPNASDIMTFLKVIAK